MDRNNDLEAEGRPALPVTDLSVSIMSWRKDLESLAAFTQEEQCFTAIPVDFTSLIIALQLQ